MSNSEIKPVETLRMPWTEIVNAVKFAGLKERLVGAVLANIRNFTDKIDNFLSISFFWQTSLKGIFGALMAPTATLRESIRGLRGLDINIKERNVVNLGIKNSAKNALLCALIFALLGFLIGFVFELIIDVQNPAVRTLAARWILSGIIVGLVGALFGGLFGGLLACIQHFTLRLIIAFHGDMPWRYVRFLNYPTKQRFLQREGGRYRFIHPLLQKHFTTIDTR
jgi:hypothetical protein